MVGVDVRRRATLLRRQQSLRGNLRPPVFRLQPGREAAHDPKPTGVRGALDADRLRGPAQHEIRRDEVSALGLDEVHESAERRSRPLELCAERAAGREVLLEGSVEGAHRLASRLGQGSATLRSASNSTFA